MSFHFPSSMLALAMLVGLAPTATAQPTASKPTTAEAGAGLYQTAFSGYRRYGDEPLVPWKQANDVVGRIGGWKAYAREAAAPSPPAGASAPHGAHKQ
jgi:hypothetical protein